MTTQIEIIDGPLAGQCHELAFDFDAPNRLGLPGETPAKDVLYWCNVRDGKAYFDEQKQRAQPRYRSQANKLRLGSGTSPRRGLRCTYPL